MNKKVNRTIALVMAFGIVCCGPVSSAVAKTVVVVNRANPVTHVKKSVLARYFLKKTTQWDDGIKVTPVDLPVSDPVRDEFSDWVLNRSPKKVETHWISESLTGGQAAPEIVNSAALVKKRVADDPGAVGYIDSNDLDDSVKVIEVTE